MQGMEAKRKPSHNMAFHRAAVLKRKLQDEQPFNVEAPSPSQGGPDQDPDSVARGRCLHIKMPIHHVGKVSGHKRKRSPSESKTQGAATKRKIDPHISNVQHPSEHLPADCSIGYLRTDVVYDIALLDDLSEALGFGPSGHLESGDPQPVTAMADISQHTVISPSDGRIDRSVINDT